MAIISLRSYQTELPLMGPRRSLYWGEYALQSGDGEVPLRSRAVIESRLVGLDSCYSLGPYLRGSQKHEFSLALLKYRFGLSEQDGDRPHTRLFGRLLASAAIGIPALVNYQRIVPIPKKRRQDAASYHLFALFREMVCSLCIDRASVEPDILQFERDVPEVKELPLGVRHAVLADSIRVCDNKALEPSVLLLDDIVATGATVSEAARALRRCGVTRVGCLSLGKRVL